MKNTFLDKPAITFSKTYNRLYLRHGPIDVFLSVECKNRELEYEAYRAVANRFHTILEELSGELSLLRSAITAGSPVPEGEIAKSQYYAARNFSFDYFVTPMICVAGAIADYLVRVVLDTVPATRVFANNGGDIAVNLFHGRHFDFAICNDLKRGTLRDTIIINQSDCIGGIATSGWSGRSHSLGIADAVTVLASSAVIADAAATLIANAVDLPGSKKVTRVAARELAPDSDLGEKLVTVDVADLDGFEKQTALSSGASVAKEMLACGLIKTAYLSLQSNSVVVCDTKSDNKLSYLHNNLEGRHAYA